MLEQNNNKMLLKRKQINKTKANLKEMQNKERKKGLDFPDYTVDKDRTNAKAKTGFQVVINIQVV